MENRLKKGLGRGLSSLLGDSSRKFSTNKVSIKDINGNKLQPRKHFDKGSLEELTNSIKQQGVIQPIVVRPDKSSEGKYEIVAGERRWLASQNAGLHEVPVIVLDIDDVKSLEFAIVENVQRQDLNPIEEATSLDRLIQEFGLTHQEAADAVGRSRAAVSNLLRLLSLDTGVKEMLAHGDIEMGHARALLSLEITLQSSIANLVVKKGMSVRETEAHVRKLLNPSAKNKKENTTEDLHISDLENKLSDTLGAKVSCQHSAKGKGKLVIQYNSLDELDGILEHIK